MIRIAYINLNETSTEIYEQLLSAASAQRQEKAARYRRYEDRLRCVAAEGLLRWAIARTPGIPVPYAVEQDFNGKPRLAGAEHFHYNLSHSGNWVIIAYGDSPVGVDVEAIRTSADAQPIARRWFTGEEYDWVFSRDENRLERFFQIWTGKESYLKYLGTGLTKPMTSFRVAPPVVEDPPGTPCPGLYLHRFTLEGACLSLCCREPEVQIRELTIDEIINR